MPRPATTDASRQRGVELGHAIQSARKSKRRSQREIANEADVPLDTLRRIEQGRIANPGVFTIAAIAAALGISLSRLVSNRRRTQ